MATETECSADRPYIVGEDSLIEALKKSSAVSPLNVKIFKVPQVLRRHKPEAYEPYVVSIGPIHRDREQVQRMEIVKQGYLRTLLSRMDISLEKFIKDFNDFLLREPEGQNIIEFGKIARDCYVPLHLDDIEFMKIMILDGCFVIQLVRKIVDQKARDDGEPKWYMGFKFQSVCHDLLLLENQLPFLVLRSLYDFIREKLPHDEHMPMFSGALIRAFSKLKSLDQYLKRYRLAGDHKDNDDKLCHILDLIRTSIVFGFKPNTEEPNENESGLNIPPATDLSEAGVKFKKNDSADNLLDIKFEDGVLTIPELTIGELTEPLFRNLIAFEQSYPDHSNEITSYAAFMDKLISSDKDIKLLSKKKILDNWLSVADGSECFRNLYRDTTLKGFQYDEVFGKVNKYYENKWNRYFEEFRRDYCSSPWKVIALTVGILLLLVNLMQFLISLRSSTLFTGIRVNELSADI